MNGTQLALLKSKIITAGYNSLTDFTVRTGFLGKNAFYKKMQNPSSFKVGEIQLIKKYCNLTDKEILAIFFD